MRKIEVKFPEIDGMRVSGATLDFENGCSVVEYVEEVEFKKGDVVYRPVFNDHLEVVFVFNELCPKSSLISNFCLYRVGSNEFVSNTKIHSNTGERLATDSEKQLLFNALEKEGKYWDEEALEVNEFERVPSDIGIYCCNRSKVYDKGDELYIGFNGNRQVLSTSNGIYTVDLNDARSYSSVNCCLKPIRHEDVKVGDTILCADKYDVSNYFKVCDNGYVYAYEESDIFILDDFELHDKEKLFKLISVK